ncbi:Hypothetical protein SRAE_1000329000 [Strongyloides ratti]|uniref:Uncharacterized protein n=1 Tax=Strongyloides ratti TaxID=34506 RepID=A0A090L5N7_STRRB|nr:Hypothetical protein SRAE_1000329000 [Strongyloides ratti]CEF65037.1 Hypothetical protein SRAE_1000329000 [Strongyloides ratti]
MDNPKHISFVKFMEYDFVRKCLYKNVHLLTDIENLAKSTNELQYFFENDKIKKDIMWLKDDQYLSVNVEEELMQISDIPILEKITFQKDTKSSELLSTASQYHGEIILYKNQLTFDVNFNVTEITYEERTKIVEKFIEELNLNDQLRKDATTLKFINSCNQNSSMILQALSLMNHSNIKRIEIPTNTLLNDQYICRKKFPLKKIFQGFPNLHEVSLYVPNHKCNYIDVIDEENVIAYIIKNLSRKKNATLIFNNIDPCNYSMTKSIETIYKFSGQYNVEIKVELNSSFSDYYSISEVFFHPIELWYSINKIVISDSHIISGPKRYIKSMIYLKFFVTLEKLMLSFNNFDIKQGIFPVYKLYPEVFSLKHFNQLKKITLYFSLSSCDGYDKMVKLFQNNLIFLGSLMPNTIEELEIINGYELSTEVTEVLHKNMPNIKVLYTNDVTFKDNDCLCSFKNLKFFISKGCPFIKVPKTVELVVVGHRYFHVSRRKQSPCQKIIKHYSERFSKYLYDITGKYIFFNDITKWSQYKFMIQNIFY